jgi:hypothetical protein
MVQNWGIMSITSLEEDLKLKQDIERHKTGKSHTCLLHAHPKPHEAAHLKHLFNISSVTNLLLHILIVLLLYISSYPIPHTYTYKLTHMANHN